MMDFNSEKHIVNLLIEFLPETLKEAREIIVRLHNPSKISIHLNDNLGVFTGENLSYYLFYLEPDQYYQKFNHHFRNEAIKEAKQYSRPAPPFQLNKIKFEFYNSLELIGDELFDNLSKKQDIPDDDLFFLNASFARFFDSLSLIQNKKRLSDLLNEAIHQGKYKNIQKAVSIDPNILKIPSVIDYIKGLPLNQQSEIYIKSGKAMNEPILSISKTEKSSLALFYLSLVDSMGFIDGPAALSFKSHKTIAEKVNALEQLDDIDYFSKLYRLFKNSKIQGIKRV